MGAEISTEANKTLVADFFQHLSEGNADGALALLDDSASWHAMGREGGLPMSGVMDKQGIGELIATVSNAFPEKLKLTPTGWTAEGDRVAVEMESYGEMDNRRIYNNAYHFLIIVSGRKIQALREYLDTQHVKQIFIDP
ncbi:MAG: nuclear transport factor 2 family protein [Cyanobacteria bacterium P01_D01_bin.73]